MRLPLALLIPAAIALGAPAHAEPDGDDKALISALQRSGISYDSPVQAITSAKAVCAFLNSGETGLEIIKDLKDNNPGMTMDRAAAFVVIASNTYCPEHLVPTPRQAG